MYHRAGDAVSVGTDVLRSTAAAAVACPAPRTTVQKQLGGGGGVSRQGRARAGSTSPRPGCGQGTLRVATAAAAAAEANSSGGLGGGGGPRGAGTVGQWRGTRPSLRAGHFHVRAAAVTASVLYQARIASALTSILPGCLTGSRPGPAPPTPAPAHPHPRAFKTPLGAPLGGPTPTS